MRNMLKSRLSYKQQQLCVQHIPAAYKVAREFWRGNRSLEFEDIQAEAMAGLVYAATTFDADRGTTFLTWCFCVVRHKLLSTFVRSYKRPRVRQLPIDRETGEVIEPQSHHCGPVEQAMENECDVVAAKLVDQLKRGMNPRSFDVLRLRDIDGLTLDEVAKRFGLTRERIRQIQIAARDAGRRVLFRLETVSKPI